MREKDASMSGRPVRGRDTDGNGDDAPMGRENAPMGGADAVLTVKNLTVEFPTGSGPLRAVDRVHFTLRRGEMLGVIGESGCGKSTVAYALLNSVMDPGRIVEGSVAYAGHGDLLQMGEEAQRLFRWQHVSVVFQASQNTLNPLQRIGEQIRELGRAHKVARPEALVREAVELCGRLQLDGVRIMRSYPHQLSGGMKQRVGILFALLLHPEVILFDEPTTALDSLSQNAVIRIIQEIHEKEGLTGLFITHDLAIVAEVADVVAVMYAGRIVELAPVSKIFRHPSHPYTQALLASIPRLTGDPHAAAGLGGQPPKVFGRQTGCLFRDRCAVRMAICDREDPELLAAADGGAVACFFARDAGGHSAGSAEADENENVAGTVAGNMDGKGEGRHAGM